MFTALSWTELSRAFVDTGTLLRFRGSQMGGAGVVRLVLGLGLVVLLTAGFFFGSIYSDEFVPKDRAGSVLALLPSLFLGFLAIAVTGSISSGGGRELVPREEAVSLPIGSNTEHFGAILMAPLNLAWLMNAWGLLVAMGYSFGAARSWVILVTWLLWLIFATTAGQALGWWVEGIRRGPHGLWIWRGMLAAIAGIVAAVVIAGFVTDLLDRAPTRALVFSSLNAATGNGYFDWLRSLGILLALIVMVTLGGCLTARWALNRPMREELRMESGHRTEQPPANSDLAMMVRIDRASIWRSVPLRRGVAVLALMPGIVALIGGLEWQVLVVLPGLVAAGAALLFGVNTWSLDGRGVLYLENMPTSPQLGFYSKARVLFELLAGAAAVTLALGALRAGLPTLTEVAAATCALVVICLQVTAACLRWSVKWPFAVDLRSARATPAPPVRMVGYSTKLALATTFVGLLFARISSLGDPIYPITAAVPLVLFYLFRLARTANLWARPEERARVVMTVAG